MLNDETKNTLLFLRYFWIFVKQFLELVRIVVAIICFFKVCKYNMETNFKKFNKSTNFFYFATIFSVLVGF